MFSQFHCLKTYIEITKGPLSQFRNNILLSCFEQPHFLQSWHFFQQRKDNKDFLLGKGSCWWKWCRGLKTSNSTISTKKGLAQIFVTLGKFRYLGPTNNLDQRKFGLFLKFHIGVKFVFNPLSASFTKWSNTLKQFVGNLPTNCLSLFDHFLGLTLSIVI